MLLLLSIAAPFAVLADSFTIKPVDLELGKSANLEFNLANEVGYYGFQADVTLPTGIEVTKVTLSERAPEKDYKLNHKAVSNGSYRIAAFSESHTAISGNDGILVNMEVSVADTYKGDEIKVSNIIFTNEANKDVPLADTSRKPGVLASGITLSPASLAMKVGESDNLTATLTPTFATNTTITWTTDDEDVATVDATGKVTAVGEGEANITATTSNGETATCEVTVATNVVKVESVTISDTTLSLTEGETATLTATVSPEGATDKKVTWTSSDTSVATVNATTGEVTAIKAGTATITAATSNTDVKATCTVTVKAKTVAVTSVSLDKTTLSLTKLKTCTPTATVGAENATGKTGTWT